MSSTEYRLVVLGSGGVGKSALVIRFIQGNFVEKYDPTIEDSYRKQLEVDGVACMLDILDTAGQEEYSAMRDSYMRTGQGFVLVYSITDQASFEDCRGIYQQLLQSTEKDKVPLVLVGNKIDLEEDRVVTREEGEQMATSFGNCKFLETSAKTNTKVDDIFLELVREIDFSQPQTGASKAEAASASAETKPKKKKKGLCSIL